jgi:hypothetical protein
MNLGIFLKILLWNIAFTFLTIVASIGIYFIVRNLPMFVSPLILTGIVLMSQLYFNSWLLEKRQIYNVRNLVYCFIQLLLVWVLIYISFVILVGE